MSTTRPTALFAPVQDGLSTVELRLREALAGEHRALTAATERLLNAFQGITLLRIRIGHKVQYQLSGFSKLHRRILQLLGLPASLYTALESSP